MKSLKANLSMLFVAGVLEKIFNFDNQINRTAVIEYNKTSNILMAKVTLDRESALNFNLSLSKRFIPGTPATG